MPLYEASSVTTIVTATPDAVLAAFRAGSRQAYVREIHLFTLTAPTTAGGVALKRATAIGTGAITGNVGVPRDPNAPAPGGQVATAWGTAPPTVTAAPAGALRRFACAAAIGNGIVWTFYEGLGIIVPANPAVNAELCLCNTQSTAPGTYVITVVFEE